MIFSTQTSQSVRRFGVLGGTKVLADAGYPALDFSFFETQSNPDMLDIACLREVRAELNRRGAVFNQAHAPFGGGFEHYTAELIPLMPTVFKAASALGVRQMIIHPLQHGRYYGHEKELFDENVAFYRSLAGLAKDSGVRIGIENMWQYHPVTRAIVDDICANPAELAALYDTLDDPEAFTVCLDVGHVALCGREPEDAIRLLGHDRLGALHVHDVNYREDLHTLPGMGKIHWDAVACALGEIDYQGELTLESDAFLRNYSDAFFPIAARFMAECARDLAERVDHARAGKE